MTSVDWAHSRDSEVPTWHLTKVSQAKLLEPIDRFNDTCLEVLTPLKVLSSTNQGQFWGAIQPQI